MTWALAPTHGRHCGPGLESNLAPISATDAVCQEHDACYGEAMNRSEELYCDEKACEALDHFEDDLGRWKDEPGLYEGQYRRGMQNVFCAEGDKCYVEDMTWEQKPQRNDKPRIPRNKIKPIKSKIIEAVEVIADPHMPPPREEKLSWADLVEEENPTESRDVFTQEKAKYDGVEKLRKVGKHREANALLAKIIRMKYDGTTAAEDDAMVRDAMEYHKNKKGQRTKSHDNRVATGKSRPDSFRRSRSRRTEVKKAKNQAKKAKKAANKAIKAEKTVIRTVKGGGFVANKVAAKKPRQRKAKNNASMGKPLMGARTGNNVLARDRTRDVKMTYTHGGGRRPDGMRLSGCELLSVVQLVDPSTGTPSGSQMKNASGRVMQWNTGVQVYKRLIGPNSFADTRLKQFSYLWQKYKFRRFSVIFESSASEFYSGEFIHYIDTDPTADYSAIDGTEQVARLISAHSFEKPFKVSQNSTCRYKPLGPVPELFVFQASSADASDTRQQYQACYILAILDAISNPNGTVAYPLTVGRLYIDYEIDFWGAAIGATSGYLPNTFNFNGNSTVGFTNDAYNGIQELGFYVPNTLSGFTNGWITKDILALLTLGVSQSSVSFNNLTASPNDGIVDINNVVLTTDGSGIGYLTCTGFGPLVVLEIFVHVSYTAGTANAIPSYDLAPQSNCTVYGTNARCFQTNTTTDMRACIIATFQAIDPKKPIVIKGTGTSAQVSAVLGNMGQADNFIYVRQAVQYVPSFKSEVPKCVYQRRHILKDPMSDIMQGFNLTQACNERDCPVCPMGKIVAMMRARDETPRFTIPEEEEEPLGEDSDTEKEEVKPELDMVELIKLKKELKQELRREKIDGEIKKNNK